MGFELGFCLREGGRKGRGKVGMGHCAFGVFFCDAFTYTNYE